MTRRLRLDLGYDGTDFRGWAAQPGLRTVQGEIEAALAMASREETTTTVAGRTDAADAQGRAERGGDHGLVHRAQTEQDPLGALRRACTRA